MSSSHLKGSVLEVLVALLHEGRTDEVIAVFEKLVARNHELEHRLAMLLSRGKSREGVSTAQLSLLLDELAESSDEERRSADEALRTSSGIDAKTEENETDERKGKGEKSAGKQPPLRRPIPDSLRRVDNPLRVPDEERPCPDCGLERTCIGHDVTEVVDLIPAEVIVRLDRREKLACRACEGNLVRGPIGDKVVPGGRLGPALVAQVLIDKYDQGLPLHRQKQRFERLGLPLSVSTLADQITWCTELLQPVARACLEDVLSSIIMHIDGTGLPVLTRKGGKRDGKGKKLGALWGCPSARPPMDGLSAYMQSYAGSPASTAGLP